MSTKVNQKKKLIITSAGGDVEQSFDHLSVDVAVIDGENMELP